MAIYSNFDGTFKNVIQIGKQGPKIEKNGQDLKITDSTGAILSALAIGEPSANEHATTKQYLDNKFGTTGAKVRSNTQSDALYQSLSARNVANGYVGLDAGSKIGPEFLPTVALTETFTVHNREGRNDLPGIGMGDMAIVLSIPIWAINVQYTIGDRVRIVDTTPGSTINYFYEAKQTHVAGLPAPTGEDVNWAVTTIASGQQTYTIGQEVLFERQIYISLVNETHNKSVSDTNRFRSDDIADAGLYICRQAPTGAAGKTIDADWVVVDLGAQVQSFNGRTGNISPKSGDYNAASITVIPTPGSDISGEFVATSLNQLALQRVNKAGDLMTGVFALASGTAALPGLIVGTNKKSGLYSSVDSAIAISYNESEKMRFGANIIATTMLDMSNNRVTNIANPVSSADAASKGYVDSKPQVTKSSTNPSVEAGVETDVHFRTKLSGTISTPYSARWNAITSDGQTYIAVSSNKSSPIAVKSDDNGESWLSMDMPSAPNATDAYRYCVTNGTGHFLAIRQYTNAANTDSQLVYTIDNGKAWISVPFSKFGWSGEFIAAKSAPGTNYVLLDNNGISAYYSSDHGINWAKSDLPANSNWIAAAGRGSTFVAISATRQTAISINGGLTWSLGDLLPDGVHYKSIASTNGVNFVVVGSNPSNAAGQYAAYSNDGGKTWAPTTLPASVSRASPLYTDVNTNGSSYIAIAANESIAARSIDGGITWQTVTLPLTAGWGRIASNNQGFVAIDTSNTTKTPFAISSNGGASWLNEVVGGIDNIFIKQNSNWLQYRGVTTAQGDARYVTKTGDQMTGRLFINTGVNGYSLQTTAGISSNTSVESLKYLTNAATIRTAGQMSVGVANQDAVTTSNTYKWVFNTEGNYEGYALKIQSVTRDGAAPIDRIICTKESTIINSFVGVRKSAKASMFHVDQDATNLNTGLSVYSPAGRSGIEVVSGKDTNTDNFIACYGNKTLISYDASTLVSSAPTYQVTTKGYVKTAGGIVAGTGAIDATSRVKTYITDGQVGLSVDSTNATVDAANVTAIDIKSRSSVQLSDTYAHLQISEGGTQVVWIGRSKAIINKRVGINALANDNAQLVIGGTDSVIIPVGTTAQRPLVGADGMIRYNSTRKEYEAYQNGAWVYVNLGTWSFKKTITNSMFTLEAGTVYKHVILATEHKLGAEVYAEFQEKLPSGNYRHASFEYELTPTGDIWIFADVNAQTDIPEFRISVYL